MCQISTLSTIDEDMDDNDGEIEEFADCVENIEKLEVIREETEALHTISIHIVVGTKDHQTIKITIKIKINYW